MFRFSIAICLGLLVGCSTDNKPVSSNHDPVESPVTKENEKPAARTEKTEGKQAEAKQAEAKQAVATFGAGCFWCVEAVLEQLDGVLAVESGYMGGQVDNPTYEQICTGRTGHAEIVRVEYDPAKISYETLLVWFFKLHDPTTLNRQGNDVGTQYRSAIFYHDDAQKAAAEKAKKTIDESKVFDAPVVTEISKASTYYPAEKYHQDYYRFNREQPYCRAVISPKLDKLGLDK